MIEHLSKGVQEVLAVGAIGAYLMDYGPLLLALPAALYYCIQLYRLLSK